MNLSKVIDIKKAYLLIALLLSSIVSFSQEKEPAILIKDSTKVPVVKKISRYDSAMQAHSPRKAAIKSAILPGLGQIYNKKYWKLPLVYGALGTCGGIFAYNIKWYKKTRFAYTVLYNKDSASFDKVDPKLRFLVANNRLDDLRYYRNAYRRDVDYSALFFLVFWGLNVVDATVDAHLKSFDVSPDLSLQVRPGYSELANTGGISLVLKIGK
ncbi:MAG TPA: DUF5683 domain-containing protein [Chitinophagaceae bacterium]|jgi:hypothetical protein|nr:DUF5683 domain-containing protein [Chitinophagaceae bacterium]HMU58238.1 DUF5683 domain-containing protein [Chitinophagaceae bacterium]